MAEKKKVYVETSVISNLTARPSPNMLDAAHQFVTREWWESSRSEFDLFSSVVVEREAAKGDPSAAALRLEVLAQTKELPLTRTAIAFAERLLNETAVPRTSFDDALHIAVATLNKMDYLLTWNCKHIANAATMPKIYRTCQAAGFDCPLICTPEQMKGE